MNVLANARCAVIRLRLLDAQPAQIRFDLRNPRGRRGLPLARIGQARPRRIDTLRQLAIATREQHFLPPAQLVAQLPVAPRLGRLALERSALLVDFEHDVVDASQVLLRRFELQLRGAPARFVLGDPRGLFDELPPVGRARAEDQPDLSLLDDRVGLGAKARIHQQLVHVAKPADLTVDQVFALAGSIEAPRDFDVARECLDDLGQIHSSVAIPMTVPVPMPVVPAAMAVAVSMTRFVR